MSTSSVTPPIKPVWTPEDTRHAAEDAELYALADQVIAAYGRLPELARAARNRTGADELMRYVLPLEAVTESVWQLYPPLSQPWPTDVVPSMLADWPAPIIHPVVIP